MKRTILILMALFVLPLIYADCSVTKNQNNVTVYDFIDPDGRDSDCSLLLLKSGVIDNKINMTRNDLYYSANLTNLTFGKTYSVFIACNKSTDEYYSECAFTLHSELGERKGTDEPVNAEMWFAYYMDVNLTEEIRLYYNNITDDKTAEIEFSGVNYTMSNTSYYYYISVTSEVEEDVNFTIYINTTPTGTIFNRNSTMRWRIPFYVEIFLYMYDGNSNSSLSSPYKNDFQYMYLQNETTKLGKHWLNSDLNFEMKALDRFLWKWTGYPYNDSIDTSLAFWSNYNNGKAKIKLYEMGNYSISLITSRVKSSRGWNYEFVFPQLNLNDDYFSKVVILEIQDEIDQVYEIFIDRFELSWFKFSMNIMWNLMYIILWIALVILTAVVSQDGKTTAIVAGATFPIMVAILALT